MPISVALAPDKTVQVTMDSSDAVALIGELGALAKSEFSSSQLLALLESLIKAGVKSPA